MKKIIHYMVLMTVLLGASSCNQWLEVDPEDRIMEEKLFANREGFMIALNGVYIELNSPSLYGRDMLVGMIDVMAQYYAVGDNNYTFRDFASYDFDQKEAKETIAAIWNKYYELIANCNAIVEHCDQTPELLGDEYYHIIKGEALALRGMLHFDVLRAWGTIYSADSTTACVPYVEDTKLDVKPLLSANEVYHKICRDLTEAESLLADFDPIITQGPLFDIDPVDGGNDMRYRTLRLNYYAVQALLARVHLYCGQPEAAHRYALKVVNAVQEPGNEMFPFINRGEYIDDRVYHSELLFALYNLKRADIYKNYFSNSLSDGNVLRVDDDRIEETYDETDYRLKYQWSKMMSPSDVEQNYFIKYKEVTLQDPDSDEEKQKKEYRYLIPMLRVSEMYYILAESEPNAAEGLKWLNKVRAARALKDLPAQADLAEELEKEYKREFIGEGQFFFYYKRVNKEEIPDPVYSWSSVDMAPEKYMLPLPDAEKNNRFNK